MSAWKDVTTKRLWEVRGRLIDCVEDVALRWAEGRVQQRDGDPRTSVQIQTVQVEQIDAVLLSRGETVPEPFWLAADD